MAFTRSALTKRWPNQSLPGRHLYFLDDHLLGNVRFARELFRGMRGMNRVFQALQRRCDPRDDLIDDAAAAGTAQLFVGFESLSTRSLQDAKKQNLGRDYQRVIRRLDDLGIMINGSFVFGLDGDRGDVFERTGRLGGDERCHHGDLPHSHAISGTALYARWPLEPADNKRLGHDDTRKVVYRPLGLTPAELKTGYDCRTGSSTGGETS